MAAILNVANFIAQHPLTVDRRLAAFGRFVRWQVRSRLQREVVVSWVQGTRLAVRRGMTGATGNIYCGLHEFEDMAFVLHFLRPQDGFADIGANIGSYTVLASGVGRARTRAFEPDPDAFTALSRNIALNGLDTLVASRQCALGPQSGEIDFTVGLDTVNHVAIDKSGQTRSVAMDTLDHALGELRPSLIKLDVEGFESEVLRGAAQTLHWPELKAIISEDGSPAVAGTLRAAGFAEFNYDPFSRRLEHEGRKSPPRRQGHNTLFVRDEDFVQQRVKEAPRIQVLGKWL
jgi:FkbM family methyltransferase